MQLSCKPCHRDTITKEAKKCCKTCKDPEPLCEDCAHRHTRMEKNKGHEMTDDLQLCSNTKTNLGYVLICVNTFFIIYKNVSLFNFSYLRAENITNFLILQTHLVFL